MAESPRLDTQSGKVFVVAELSANHGGSLARARDTIREAAHAGADAIKLQTYTPDTLTIDSDREEFLVKGGLWNGRRLHDLYAEAQTPWAWHEALIEEGRRAGVPVFSTPFDRTAVDFLELLNVPAYKIASFEIVDLELLEVVAATRKPMILSTGMASLAEIAEAVETIRRVWCGVDHGLTLLRCVSAYPADASDFNLAAIPHLAQAFDCPVGLSDHTLGSTVAVAAVALGACMIEKHFTLARSHGGPDAAFSLEPAELRQLVEAVRLAEKAVGSVRYGSVEAERGSLRFRRSIFAVRDIASGESISRENVRVIRPGDGLAPRFLPFVLGRRARTAIARGTPLSLELLEP